MKRALSLILGLLVLLTVFSIPVSAEVSYQELQTYMQGALPALVYFDGFTNVEGTTIAEGWYYIRASSADYRPTLYIETTAGNTTVDIMSVSYAYYINDIFFFYPVSIPSDAEIISVRDNNGYDYIIFRATGDEFYLRSSSGTTTVTLDGSALVWLGANRQISGLVQGPMTLLLTGSGEVTVEASVDEPWAYIEGYVDSYEKEITFYLKDALTGQPLQGVTVKEGGTVLGTIDDGGVLNLTKGTHTLTFEKSGYWSVTKTIVQSDMSVSVEMYPSSTAFQFLNFPSDIQVYENSIYELTFTISPITTDATYNTYLSISGLNNVLEVKKAGQVITPESGKYYLGDISGDTQISIKFKAGSVGTHSFTITLTSNDAIMSSTYTTSKQVAYNVIPLPFSVQMPSEWQVGANELRVSEASGQSILITAILKDSNGVEVWSDSASLDPYAAYTFQVNVPSEGSYTLELQFNGQAASWDITVNPAITLLTETVTASEGDIATVQVKINNPSSNTKYYDIILEGPIIEGNVTKSVSVAPLSEKTVDVSFQVPTELTYDAYDLNVKVYEGDALQYSDIVHLVIESGGFSLPFFGGGSSSIDSTWLWLGAGVLALFVFIMALRRR